MTSRLILSLTAFSLTFTTSMWADNANAQEENDALIVDEQAEDFTAEHKNRRVAFTQNTSSVEEEANADEPKVKPHFAGARRKYETAKEKSKKAKKNPWFFSKTQPKKSKKNQVEIEKELTELPEDRPYFTKANNEISPALVAQAGSSSLIGMTRSVSKKKPKEVDVYCCYPSTGFKAPRGHVFFTGEWLYWRTRQEGMEFATTKQIEFDFKSGFRAGIGVHFPGSGGWSIFANYTNFNPSASKSTTGATYPLFLFEGAGVATGLVTAAQGHWKVEFQSLDVEFGNAYYLSKHLVLNPFFGFKGGWIHQHANFDYEGGYIPVGETFHTYFKNHFKGAGPLVGTDVNWDLGAGFSFFGNFATALMIGEFNNLQTQDQPIGTQVVVLSNDFHQVSPFLQLVAGLAWDWNFNHDRSHFGITAGFESQYWWDQNQTEQFTADTVPTYVRQKGDLSFYGLTLQARLDF